MADNKYSNNSDNFRLRGYIIPPIWPYMTPDTVGTQVYRCERFSGYSQCMRIMGKIPNVKLEKQLLTMAARFVGARVSHCLSNEDKMDLKRELFYTDGNKKPLQTLKMPLSPWNKPPFQMNMHSAGYMPNYGQAYSKKQMGATQIQTLLMLKSVA